MINVILLIFEVIFSYVFLLYTYKKYKEDGIYIWIVIAFILSSLMCIKHIEINNINMSLGIGISSTIYIANNILIQKKGNEYTKNNIIMLIVFSIIFTCILILSGGIISSDFNNFTSLTYDNILFSSIKYMLANIISIIIGLYINNYIYYQLRKIKNKIWISNILSALIFTFVEVVIFITITNFNNGSLYVIMMSLVIRYVIKIIILVLGTYIIYIANNFRERL